MKSRLKRCFWTDKFWKSNDVTVYWIWLCMWNCALWLLGVNHVKYRPGWHLICSIELFFCAHIFFSLQEWSDSCNAEIETMLNFFDSDLHDLTGSLWIMLGIWSCGVINWSLLHPSQWSRSSTLPPVLPMAGPIFLACNCKWSYLSTGAYLTSCWQSDGLQTAVLSENDLLACCGFECGDGCEGGYPIRAWQYFKRTGVVTDKVYHHTLNPKL